MPYLTTKKNTKQDTLKVSESVRINIFDNFFLILFALCAAMHFQTKEKHM